MCPSTNAPLASAWQGVSSTLLAAVPLSAVNPVLDLIAAHVAQTRPGLFDRLGTYAGKRFLIDPIDVPFVLSLKPEPERPHLTAHRRHELPEHDARIAGTFLDLMDMMDASLDGDALFFSRSLVVSGDTAAIVALRNALDDFDGSALETALGAFGPLAGPVGFAVSALRRLAGRSARG